jgi:glycosyltransferase involved in cell wall biosynthesis
MRILHILNDVTDRGNGIVNTAVDLAIEQTRQGCVVGVVSAGGGYETLLQRLGVHHFTLDQSRHPVKLLRAVPSFQQILIEFRPDVVHAHMRTGLLVAWFSRRHQSFALIGHVHNVHDRFASLLMGIADRVIAVSESVAATMASRGIPAKKIRVVLNRILGSPRRPALQGIEPKTLARPSIVTVAGMTSRKGIEELITAFEIVGRDFPDAHLYLVGDGPERKQFEQQASRSLHRARIHFEGFQRIPQAYLLSAGVFVLASRRDSCALVLVEAREAGCAIVATNVDGTAEALEGGRAGVLVPPRNSAALAEALCRMIGNEEELSRWRIRARQAIENYSIDAMVREVNNVYEELLDEKGWHGVSNVAWLK